MYYKRVNRGLTFTKPGVYAFGLVLLIGMIAVTTGINGLYVFLSAGLGGFIISGLLSEKAMKSCRISQVRATLADAEQPFMLTFTIENQSKWFSVFAMQNQFMLEPPRFRLIASPRPAFATVRLTRIPPASAAAYEAAVIGMPRGNYEKVLAMQLTTFPFGILEKFKLLDVPSSLLVAPKLDRGLLEELRALLRQKLGLDAADQEFFCHRPYTPQDGVRDIDWRKSAGRQPGDWVVKQYRTPAAAEALTLEAPWASAMAAKSEAVYELHLSRIRTALKALEETGRPYLADFGGGLRLAGGEACLAALAAAPVFEQRAQGLKTTAPTAPASTGARLVLDAGGVNWRAPQDQRAAGANG